MVDFEDGTSTFAMLINDPYPPLYVKILLYPTFPCELLTYGQFIVDLLCLPSLFRQVAEYPVWFQSCSVSLDYSILLKLLEYL